jgi:deoxyribodipyrimidine photo-lyase
LEAFFETNYSAILQKIDFIDPIAYGDTRNYLNGNVTYLSPYISRGVISTRQVLEQMFAKGYHLNQMESFVRELCWRDYFQRIGQVLNLDKEIKQPQSPVSNQGIPVNIVQANTGIIGIDKAIQDLYTYGYLHNHSRMYIASIACNIAHSHWHHVAQWMYYHLLDGDWASNACSWQWVAGAFSTKKYFANQENINRYSLTNQNNTFLDLSYEEIQQMDTPLHLAESQRLVLETALPQNNSLVIDSSLPTFIYNYYNLDPMWHAAEKGNRILLLEPEFFRDYPVDKKCIDFMLALASNIPGIQVYTGSFESLCQKYSLKNIYYKEHPLNGNYTGYEESRDWISDSLTGYFPSFFNYWKKIEKQIHLKYT